MIVETLLIGSIPFLKEYVPASVLNVAGGTIKRSLHDRLSNPDEVLRNHDLQRLTAAAVELVVRYTARLTGKHAGDVAALADRIPREWPALMGYVGVPGRPAIPDGFKALGDRQVHSLISGLPEDPWLEERVEAAGPDRDEWIDLLSRLDGGKAWARLPDFVQRRVVDDLVGMTPFAVRELLKHDVAKGDGLAFAGYHLIFMDEVRKDLQEILGQLANQSAATADLDAMWTRLEQKLERKDEELAGRLGVAIDRLRDAGAVLTDFARRLDGVDRNVTATGDRVADVVRDEVAGLRQLLVERLFTEHTAKDQPEVRLPPPAVAAPAGSVDLFDLVAPDTPDDELGLALIAAFNDEARRFYRYRVHREEPERPLRSGDDFWRQLDFEALRNYVRVSDRDGAYVDTRIPGALAERSARGERCGLWLVGEAGTGKTTALQYTYFQMIGAVDPRQPDAAAPGTEPVPWLLQPHLLGPAAVERLRTVPTESRLDVLLSIWLENRGIHVPSDREARLLASVRHHLREGRIVPLIDGFDELSRMALQNAMLEGVVNVAQHFVVASRPEALGPSLPAGEKVRLKSGWPFGDTREYLVQRLPPVYGEDIVPLMRYLYGNESLEWLRNPRYLNIFVQILDDLADHSAEATRGLVALLGEGEFRLLEVFEGAVLRKLKRQAARISPDLVSDDLDAEITERFERIAAAQLREGGLPVDAETDPLWKLIAGAGELLLANGPEHRRVLKFLNYNFIDFFLAGPIAREVNVGGPITYCHKWSEHQVRFVAERLMRGMEDAAARKEGVRVIWDGLEQFRGDSARPEGEPSLDSRFGAVNLVHLAIRVETDFLRRDRSQDERASRRQLEVTRDLSRLDLAEAYLSDLSFRTDFVETNLASAHLNRSRFVHCDFSGASLRRASAEMATFEFCDFALASPAGPGGPMVPAGPVTNVDGMLIRQARFDYCGSTTLETMERAGADRRGSRYVGLFGQIFHTRQHDLLGDGVTRGELAFYVPWIVDALSQMERSGPVYMIDLMAGWSESRLAGLMQKERFAHVHVLAIDKETRGLAPLKDRLGSRFAAVPRTIRGRVGLAKDLRENCVGDPSHADIIVGKKALHELPRDAQIDLLKECQEVLRPGGKLVLFADSPSSMSPEGYDRLDDCLECLRENVRENAPPAGVYRRLVTGLSLNGDADDCALFANLWVAMKDWANGNASELRDRYFSSLGEITSWGEQAGFEVTRVAGPEQELYYVLQARRFNEVAINELGLYLEGTGGRIHRDDHGLIAQQFAGNERYRVFVEFADTHLWDFESDAPRPGLGIALDAVRIPVPYDRLAPGLSAIRQLPEKGVAFRFPVHVIEMTKLALRR